MSFRSVNTASPYDKRNDSITKRIVDKVSFLNGKRPYNPTPWLFNGDLRTIFPFATYPQEHHHYIRRWVQVDDEEAVAIDISFPKRDEPVGPTSPCGTLCGSWLDLSSRYHDPSKPLILLLHGLNGGSNEKYIADMTGKALGAGHTVVVFISRGMMFTPIQKSCFHGARSTDAYRVINVLHAALGNMLSETFMEALSCEGRLPLISAFSGDVMATSNRPQWRTGMGIVGFSMGAIIGSKYATSMGSKSGLSFVVAFSSACDVWRNGCMEHSGRVWQPIFTFELKRRVLAPNQALLQDGVPVRPVILDALARSGPIPAFDASFTANFHGYDNVLEYYRDQSCTTYGKFSIKSSF